MADIREVKSQVAMPVTYADVWEFWLRYPDVQNAVDFVTIHILPYWEDFPLPAGLRPRMSTPSASRVAAAIPDKDILIGEIGWPSAGRMREGARPSPLNQARVIQRNAGPGEAREFQRQRHRGVRSAVEARLEGAVGGHWGIIDRDDRAPKFVPRRHGFRSPGLAPRRRSPASCFAALMFGAAFASGRKQGVPPAQWLHIAALALVPGVLIGWTIETVPVESFDVTWAARFSWSPSRSRTAARHQRAST